MKLRLALGADHAGYAAKTGLVRHLSHAGYKVVDLGTSSEDPCDYPELAFRVARAVGRGRCDRGILVCGSGIGMSIAANKVRGVRAAVVWSRKTAQLASQHNWCNVLCLPGRLVASSLLKKMVEDWLSTLPEKGGRHERRVRKIEKIEASWTEDTDERGQNRI